MNKVKSKLKESKAITLIALVITIVVLIILAGVGINALLGNSGIIKKAQEAQGTMNKNQESDTISVILTEWRIEKETKETNFEEFMKEKFGEDKVTVVKENEAIVTMESGNKYKVTTDGTITSTKGISINKSNLTLELEEGKTVTEELTASLSEITGEITWSNSDNSKATISGTTGESITVTAVAVGETTITATCGDYTAICTVKVTKAVTVNKGAFVEYNVAYIDMYNSNNKYTATNGWRLLDYTKNADGTYSNVKLISTGVPAKLYYYYNITTNNSWWVKASTQLKNFKNVLGSEYQYYTGTSTYYGLQVSAGLYYNFKDIKFAYGTSSNKNNKGYFTEITSNGTTYNSANTTETTGSNLFIPTGVNASVRLMTLPEMNTMLGRTDIDSNTKMTDPTGADGLFVLQNIKDITGMSAYTYSRGGDYWLASPYPFASDGNGMCDVNYYGGVGDGGVYQPDYRDNGVRPVVCLTSNIQFTDNGNGVLKF